MREPIYNQTIIPRDKWRYGLRSSSATGCGWIATYNALVSMGYDVNVEALIRAYERQFPLLHGNIGTFSFAPAMLLKSWGYPTRTSANLHSFDSLCRESDAAILFYWWRSGLRLGRHFVAVTYRDGQFYGYNTYYNSLAPDPYGPSLQAFLKPQRFFAPFLTTIQKK